jgi:hypothetical protein
MGRILGYVARVACWLAFCFGGLLFAACFVGIAAPHTGHAPLSGGSFWWFVRTFMLVIGLPLSLVMAAFGGWGPGGGEVDVELDVDDGGGDFYPYD